MMGTLKIFPLRHVKEAKCSSRIHDLLDAWCRLGVGFLGCGTWEMGISTSATIVWTFIGNLQYIYIIWLTNVVRPNPNCSWPTTLSSTHWWRFTARTIFWLTSTKSERIWSYYQKGMGNETESVPAFRYEQLSHHVTSQNSGFAPFF